MTTAQPLQYVYIVEDDQSVRESLSHLVETEGFKPQTFASAEELLAEASPERIAAGACMLLDIRLAGDGGLSLFQKLSTDDYTLPVIIISAHADMPLAVRAMKHGAADLIEKPFDPDQVLARMRDAVNLKRRQSLEHSEVQQVAQQYGTLTRRERQVMRLVTQGALNKQIAATLKVSTKTVESHRSRVMEKMGASSLAELVRAAVALERHGLIKSDVAFSLALGGLCWSLVLGTLSL